MQRVPSTSRRAGNQARPLSHGGGGGAVDGVGGAEGPLRQDHQQDSEKDKSHHLQSTVSGSGILLSAF